MELFITLVPSNNPSLVRFLLLLLFSGLPFLVYGQTNQIDSLRRLVDHEGDSQKKVALLNELSFTLFDLDAEQANATTLKALQVARKIRDKKGEGWALAYRGLYFFLSGELSEASENFAESLSLARELGDDNLQTYSTTQLGNVCRDKGSFDSAYYFYRQAKQMSQKADPHYRSVVNMNLARCYLINNKPDSALLYVSDALKIREQQKKSAQLSDTWILMGNCYRALDNFEEAERYYQKASGLSKSDQIIQVDYLLNMGEIYFGRGDFQHAMENWNAILTNYQKFQYKYALAALLLRMGSVFEEQGYYDLSIEYLTNGLQIADRAGYQYLRGRIYSELSWMYYRSRNFEDALKHNLQAEKILKQVKTDLEVAGVWDLRGLIERNLKNYDTALYYHEKSLATRYKLNNKKEISDGNFNLGEFHMKMGRPKMALPYYYESLGIDKKLGTKYGMSLSYNRIGKIYTELGQFDSAKINLDRSLAIAIPISSTDVFRDDYIDLAAYYEKLGKPEMAIPYYKKYNQLTDSIFNAQTAQSLASYRTLYEVERSEKKMELLDKDNELNKAQVQKQRTILYSVLAGFIALLVLAAFYYRFSKRLRKLNASLAEKNAEVQLQSEGLYKANEALSKLNLEIASQKEEIQAQAEELAESNQTISGINESLEQRIESRTAELKQAYKELDTFFYRSSHDFRRPLTTFMGLAEVAKIMVKDKSALELFEGVNETARNLDKMLMKLQSISDLGVQELIYKEVSIKEIFSSALLPLDHQILQRNIRIKMEVDPDVTFYSYPALVKVLVENLIENSVSFCGTVDPCILLKAYYEHEEIVIAVEDNGQGIEKEYIDRVFEMYFRGNERSKGNGLGLYIVKKTADRLKGRIVLNSEPGVGTKISIFLPGGMEHAG